MIDTEALRKKVIDLAMQGKLTQQLPEDGNAEDLYIQIQKEKAKLVKEGKIKKEKPLPEISADEIPFEIPKNWKWVRWGNIVNVVSARRVHQSDWKEEGIPFYRAREIATLADTGIVNNELYISEELYEEFSKSGVPHAGDLMVTGVGTLGKTYVVKESERFYYKDASVLCFENYAGMIATFLKRVMETSLMRSQIESNSGGTTVDTLTMVRINQYLMPLPPLDEQKRIVKIIDEIYAQIDLISDFQQQYEADCEVLRGKIIDAGIRGKLTEQLQEDGNAEDLYVQIQEEKAKLIKEGKIKKEKPLPEISDDEVPFEIPSNWKWVRWGNIVNVVSARRVHQADWRDEGIPFYRAREIAVLADTGVVNNDLYISEGLYNDFSESGVPQAGDLMVTGVGTLGKTYVVQENDRFYYKDASVLCFENYANVNSDFLKRVMESRLMRSQINSNSGGTTVDTLTMVRMNQYILPLPPREEQKRISNTITGLLSLITE